MNNAVRAVLGDVGVCLRHIELQKITIRVQLLAENDPHMIPLDGPLVAVLAPMLEEFAREAKQAPDIARHEAVCQRPMPVRGVGPITAFAFQATIYRSDRLRHFPGPGVRRGMPPALSVQEERHPRKISADSVKNFPAQRRT